MDRPNNSEENGEKVRISYYKILIFAIILLDKEKEQF